MHFVLQLLAHSPSHVILALLVFLLPTCWSQESSRMPITLYPVLFSDMPKSDSAPVSNVAREASSEGRVATDFPTVTVVSCYARW